MDATNDYEDMESHKIIPLFKSPVDIDLSAADGYLSEPKVDHRPPYFVHHEEASNLELFYDLFFAANYTVLTEVHIIRDLDTLKSYIGFYSILWITWSLLSLYDVRYLTDCLFERVMRAIHLGVMLGFAVTTPDYNPHHQNPPSFSSLSRFLAISRLALCAEYASTLWHVRNYPQARRSMYAQISVHGIASVIYIGIIFSFTESDKQSRGYIAWYIVPAAEAIITLAMSNFSPVLSLTNTHLMKRMSLLTIVIIGDGVVVLAKEVSLIVGGSPIGTRPWNPITIGIVSAAGVSIYLVFLIYMDWKTHDHLRAWRQQLWTMLHFPVHLALVLFIEGFVQFVLWSKIFDILKHLGFHDISKDSVALANATSAEVAKNMSDEVNLLFDKYHPKYDITLATFRNSINNITGIPNSFWPELSSSLNVSREHPPVLLGNGNSTRKFNKAYQGLQDSILGALFSIFEVDITDDLARDLEISRQVKSGLDIQTEDVTKTIDRYITVFQYVYVAAACALASMTLLTVVSRVSAWKGWPRTRVFLCLLLSLPVGLIVLLVNNYGAMKAFLVSAWPLPTLTLVWLVVMLLTHVGNGIVHFRRSKSATW